MVGGQVRAGLEVDANLVFLAPTYTFETPVLGGRPSITLIGAFGNMDVSVDATRTGPRGSVLDQNPSDSLFGGSDLYYQGALRWNDGNHNYMTYVMGGIPIGSYETGRLANIGIGHWSIDGGGGYTYFNPKNGRELSAVAGFTHHLENPDTDYQNGVDVHLDWGASRFLSEHWHVGARLTAGQGDSGDGATLGDFKSRVVGIGLLLRALEPKMVRQRQGLLRVRGQQPARRLERVAHAPRPAEAGEEVTGVPGLAPSWGTRERGDARSPRRTSVHGGAWSVAPQWQGFMGLDRRYLIDHQ